MTLPTQVGRPLHDGRFPGTAEAVRAHLQAVEDAASASGVDDARLADMQIVLGEVLNNIVEHAFTGGIGGWIECSVAQQGRDLLVRTRDDGSPLPPALLLAGRLPRMGRLRDDLPESGFGWFLVHSLTDDMTYERIDGTNLLSFSLPAD